ncbi:MAG TPA: NfeD family protein [Edaphocola sp.]|nr:NfeD family protein [Edaphocola sp.]
MFEFLDGLEPLLKSFWYIALISSAVFVLQSLMTLLGSGHDLDGVTADFDGNLDHADAPFQLFSFRNLVNFLLGFGWSGVVFYPAIDNKFLLVFIATIVGSIFILLFFVLIKQLMKLSEDNTFKYENLINLIGQVYLTIPGAMNGKGKVQISVKGSNHELSAMTEGERLPSGTSVTVTEIRDNILIVVKTN